MSKITKLIYMYMYNVTPGETAKTLTCHSLATNTGIVVSFDLTCLSIRGAHEKIKPGASKAWLP